MHQCSSLVPTLVFNKIWQVPQVPVGRGADKAKPSISEMQVAGAAVKLLRRELLCPQCTFNSCIREMKRGCGTGREAPEKNSGVGKTETSHLQSFPRVQLRASAGVPKNAEQSRSSSWSGKQAARNLLLRVAARNSCFAQAARTPAFYCSA